MIGALLIIAACHGNIKQQDRNSKDTVVFDQAFDKDISLITLIAAPEKYNGRHVRVQGFLNLEFEGNAIYLHKDDYELHFSKNAVWVNTAGTAADVINYKACNKHYVILEGTFSMDKRSGVSYSGAITNITRISLSK
jgi:hypothetical protein